MIANPEIVHTLTQPAAVIHLDIPRSEMGPAFHAALEEILAVLQAQFVEPTGPVFAHHLRMSPARFDFEIGLPINGTITNEGRIRLGELPARARVARTTYEGPYEGLPQAWGEFTDWMNAQGLKQAEDLWEIYAYGPQSNPDPGTWRTELNRPLAD